MKAPCYKCQDRSADPNCHSELCKKWADYEAWRNLIYEYRKADLYANSTTKGKERKIRVSQL